MSKHKNDDLTKSDRKTAPPDINKLRLAAAFTQQISYTSPLPPPEVLAQYRSMNLLEKVVEMTETQASHRRALERDKLNADIHHQKQIDRQVYIGQGCATIIALTAIFGGLYAICNGQPTAGTFIGLLGIGSIVTAYLKK